MTIINLISKNGPSKQVDMPFSELLSIKLGDKIDLTTGFGFAIPKTYEKISDYTFKEL